MLTSAIEESIAAKSQLLLQSDLLLKVVAVSELVAKAFASGNRVYFCGNGGSAADAQHLAAEFSGPFYNRQRPALPAEALHTNSSYLTAVANDYDYASVYARYVDGIMQPGDILFGLSTSGNSANIVKAFEAARSKGITTIGMTGTGGGQMKALSDYLLNMPSANTPRIQECHMLVGHSICQMVESILYPAA